MNIVVLAHNEASLRYLLSNFNQDHHYTVVLEQSNPRKMLFKKLRRFIRRNGVLRGAIRFMQFLRDLPYVLREARSQEAYLTKHLGHPEFPAQIPLHSVPDVNHSKVVEIVRQANPELIIVFGTGIIQESIIKSISAPGRLLVNNHVGITPEYRGVKSELYCILNNELEMAGSTLHVLDVGLDNGQILLQRHLDLQDATPAERYDYRHLRLKNIEMTADMFNELISSVARGEIPQHEKTAKCSRAYSTPSRAQYLQYYQQVNKHLARCG